MNIDRVFWDGMIMSRNYKTSQYSRIMFGRMRGTLMKVRMPQTRCCARTQNHQTNRMIMKEKCIVRFSHTPPRRIFRSFRMKEERITSGTAEEGINVMDDDVFDLSGACGLRTERFFLTRNYHIQC